MATKKEKTKSMGERITRVDFGGTPQKAGNKKILKKEKSKDICGTETELTIAKEQDGSLSFLLSFLGKELNEENRDFAQTKLDEAILEQITRQLREKNKSFNIEEFLEAYKEKLNTLPPVVFTQTLSFPNIYHIINETFEANKQKEVIVFNNFKQKMFFSNTMTPLDFEILAVVYNLIKECLKRGQKYFSVRDVVKNYYGTKEAEKIKNVDFDYFEQKIIYLSRCMFSCQVDVNAVDILKKKRNKQKEPTLTPKEREFIEDVACETETQSLILPTKRLTLFNKKSGRKETAFKIDDQFIYLNILFKGINQFTTIKTEQRRLPEKMEKKPEFVFLKSKILRFIQNNKYNKHLNKINLTDDFNNFIKDKKTPTKRAKQQALRRFKTYVIDKILEDKFIETKVENRIKKSDLKETYNLKTETNADNLTIFLIKDS